MFYIQFTNVLIRAMMCLFWEDSGSNNQPMIPLGQARLPA